MLRSRVHASASSVTSESRAGWTRRHAVKGLAVVVASLPVTVSCETSRGVCDFRRPGDPDDTAALIRALEVSNVAYFPGGGGSAPDGAYLLRSADLRSGATIRGDGEASVLRVAPGAGTALSAVSSGPDKPLQNIVVRDLRIEGRVTETGFREHWNLVVLSGVSGVRIERVQFVGFAGDGLYIGAEQEGLVREPRIIRDVLVQDCLFDGVSNDNRNGISVTGGTGITINRCHFRRCTRPTMPGPIDFEPDSFAFYRLGRLRVTNCDFQDCGGNVGQIALVVPAIVPQPHDVLISGNSFRRYCGTGGDVVVTINRQPDTAMPAMNCVIEHNVGMGGVSGVQIFSGKGITVRNNRWTGYAGYSSLGHAEPTAGVMDVSVSDEQFVGCGWREGVVLAVYKGDGIRLEGVRFRQSGNGGPTSAPLYIGTGRIRRLALVDNDWRDNPRARGLVIVERGADYDPGTTAISGNLVPKGHVLPVM